MNANGDFIRLKWGKTLLRHYVIIVCTTLYYLFDLSIEVYDSFLSQHIFIIGVGRMIAEARIPPIVLPLYHIGMEDILPEIRPYIPRLFKRLTLLVGEPIDFTAFLNARKTAHTSAVVLRKQITDLLQEKMSEMKTQAEVLHQNWIGHWPVAYRTL